MGLSADGRSAGGYVGSVAFGTTGFLWTADGGRNDFGISVTTNTTRVLGISGDGLTVVGGGPNSTDLPFRWSATGGYQSLGTIPGFANIGATDANYDGSIIVGTADNGVGGTTAFRWTQAGGMQPLGGGTRAYAVSGNGGAVVGDFTGSGSFVWTVANGLQSLTGLDGTPSTNARAVNHDGSIIVGTSISPSFVTSTTMWVNGVAIELVNDIPSTRFTPFGVSDDGTVVAGDLGGSGSGLHRTAVWTVATGTVPLTQYLSANGVSLPEGINLGSCTAISADGLSFAGYTTNTPFGIQGWVATVPTPGVLSIAGIVGCFAARRRRA